jgi:hypothetical protein
MTEERYGSGPGAIETRLGGAAMLAVILYILYDMFLRGK